VSGLSDLSGLGIVLRQPLTTETTSPHPLRRNNKIPNQIINKNKKRNEHDKKHKNLTLSALGGGAVIGTRDISA
jgi:hypothetical protein